LIRDDLNQNCKMGISPDDVKSDKITIGSQVMSAFTTIFDFGEVKRIGFWHHDNDNK